MPERLADLVIDALFGVGLNRAMSAACMGALAAVQNNGIPILAVDVPSGVDGTSGATINAVAACIGALWIINWPFLIVLAIVPILAPFPNIPNHIV